MAQIYKSVIISEDVVHLNLNSIASVIVSPETMTEAIELTTITEEELIQIKALARDEGYTSGHSQGLSDGIEQANALITEPMKTLNALLQNIPTAISENRRQLSTDIADIVLSITQQLFIHQQHNQDTIAQQISWAIEQLNDKQNIELSLHPHDVALLQQGKINIDLQHCKNLRVIPDESLRLGGCIIRSEHGVFDAGIERQIDNLKQVLLQMKHRDQHD